jgi:hypothetical protein
LLFWHSLQRQLVESRMEFGSDRFRNDGIDPLSEWNDLKVECRMAALDLGY